MEFGFFALQGLPKEYATVVEILEPHETAVSLDVSKPKLMQKEKSLKLERELRNREEGAGGVTTAYLAKRSGSK